jgi:hypothetical protein
MAKKKKTQTKRKTQARPKKAVDLNYLKRFCNLRPDSLDPRDHPYMALGVAPGAPTLPKKVDHSKETRPVGNQGHTGSCVGWATAHGLRRWLHHQAAGQKKPFSVRFVWMTSKEIDPWTPNVAFDLSGTRIRDAFKVMNKYGACPDNLWKFREELPNPDRERKILQEALRYRIGAYHALNSNEERRVHLARTGPFVVGVPVHANWAQIGTDGLVPDPAGALLGGHAVLVVGYDDKKKRFKFQNSWGSGWGARGNGYFTYDYMEDHSWNSWGADRL